MPVILNKFHPQNKPLYTVCVRILELNAPKELILNFGD